MPLLSKVSLPNLRARSKSDAALTESTIPNKRSAFFRRGSNDEQDDSIAEPLSKLHKKTSFPSLRLKRQQDAQATAQAVDMAPRSLAKMLSLPSLTRDPNKKGLRYRHEQPPPPVPVIDQQYKDETSAATTSPKKELPPPPVPLKSILVNKSDTPRKSVAGLNLFSRHQSTVFERSPPVIRHHREIIEHTSPKYTTEFDDNSDISSVSDYGDTDADYSIRSPSDSTRQESIFSRKSTETTRNEIRLSNESFSSVDEYATWKPPKLIIDKRLPLNVNEAMQMRARSSSFHVNNVLDFAPRKMSEPVVPSLPLQQEPYQEAARDSPSKSQFFTAIPPMTTVSSNASRNSSKGSTLSAPSRSVAAPARPARPSNLLLEQPSKRSPETSIKTHLPDRQLAERQTRLDRISYMVGKSFIKGFMQRPGLVNESRVEAIIEDPTMAVDFMPGHPPKPSYMDEKSSDMNKHPRMVMDPSYLDQMMSDPTKTFSETVSWKSPKGNVPIQFSNYDYLFEEKRDISQEMALLPPVTRPRTPEPIPETIKVRSFRLGGVSAAQSEIEAMAKAQAKSKAKKRSDVVSGVVSDWTKLLIGEAFDRASKWQTVEEEEDDGDENDNGTVLRVREHEKGVFEVVI